MIKFVVGIFEKEMMLHAILVAEQSLVLDSMVNGGMKEARDKVVVWKDVDEQTFALFAEFVYTGEYTLPRAAEGVEYQYPPPPPPIESSKVESEHGFTEKSRRKILTSNVTSTGSAAVAVAAEAYKISGSRLPISVTSKPSSSFPNSHDSWWTP